MAAQKTDLRELVLGMLLEITRDGAYSHRVLSDTLSKYQYLDKKDRAFITRVTEGTLENLIQMNYVIDQFSKTPVRKQRPVIRCILQSGVYQILYMDAVPDAAACNEAVALAKKKGFGSLAGFVNGVLRTVSRSREQIRWPQPDREPERYLSVRYSIPEWIIRMWKEQFSYDWTNESHWQEMCRLLEAFQKPAPVTVRTNTGLCTPLELKHELEQNSVTVRELREVPGAFLISGFDHIGALEAFRKGFFYIQDLNSMMVVEAAAPGENDFVIDVCAAPGGKSVHMAQLLRGTGRVLARDLTQEKADLLLQNKSRCQVANMRVQVWDATIVDETLVQQADLVLADVPCSGLGVLRRKKEIRYHMTPDTMRELVSIQRRILTAVRHYVKPGGRLVYSTCTIHNDENEGNAGWFVKTYPEFSQLSGRQLLPGEAYGDGFYIAVFEKNREDGKT